MKVFDRLVLGKRPAEYALCRTCDLLQAVEPSWLEEAYQSPVSRLDTGIMARNIKTAQVLSVLIRLLFDSKGVFLDYAGGYGVLVRIMRDYGFDFLWQDKYAENLFAQGFEREGTGRVELVSLVECAEHFLNPLSEFRELLGHGGSVFFTTKLRPESVPDPDAWTYYAFATGQHISFYSLKTLHYVADEFGLRLSTDGRDVHLLSDKRLSDKLVRMIVRWSGPLSYLARKGMRTKALDDHAALKKAL